jgi:hypothetical protein
VATDPGPLRRLSGGPFHGVALGLYFTLLPFVVVAKWKASGHSTHEVFVRILLVGLTAFWLIFLAQLMRNIARLRRGLHVGTGGSAWLAGLVIATLPFLVAASAVTSPPVTPSALVVARAAPPVTTSSRAPARPSSPGPPLDLASLGGLSLALVAKRRGDDLRHGEGELDPSTVEENLTLLRATNPALVDYVRHEIGERRDGVLRLVEPPVDVVPIGGDHDSLAVCVLREDERGVLLSFAREGGCLRVPAQWSEDDIIKSIVGLHDGGRLCFTRVEPELLRTLATRTRSQTLVLYLGAARRLDDGLRACAVTVEPIALDEELEAPASSRPDPRRRDATADPNGLESGEVRVELLRADPRVVGIVEPFTDTLRRRCVEMTAYLALHRHEPVTGDRLRTRVLTHADVDASTRTLANTASAVRRSLGLDDHGPRLHPVTSAGLYVTHGLTSDVEIFHALVTRSRSLPLDEAAPFLQRALALVRGEPLASALRGFEWFLAEGLSARLQREGEWAALALHEHALAVGDVELAFWAIAQGRLIDPYSDELLGALARVPRLREFGGDGSGAAQHQPVGPDRRVAASRPLAGLANEVAQ